MRLKAGRPGDYNRRFLWEIQHKTTEPTTGAPIETFTPNGYLWGTLEPLNAGHVQAFALQGAVVNVRIRIRNRPPLRFVDHLTDQESGFAYHIDMLLDDKEHNQLVLACHRLGVEPPGGAV